jgi:hypothetical protein
MSDAVTAKLLDLAKRAHGTVQVGFIDSDQAPIAFWNEFGHKGRFPSPPRPFFRTMVSNESGKWPEMMAGELKRSKMDGHHTLAFMGEEIDGDLKQSIMEFDSVPLAPSTIRRKGFDKQLIDTGDMLSSTGYRVSQGDVMVLNSTSGEYEARK